jgi:S-(hydroxymethyl)glutathione dehydrogenase/alcohol dehydrogenase
LRLSRKCGATEIINSSKQDAWNAINSILNKEYLDVFIDNTGNTEIISKGYELVSAKGRVVLVGVPSNGKACSINTLPLHFGKSITGSHGGDILPQFDIARYMKLINFKNIQLDEIISEVNSLYSINEMIDHMRDGTSAGRCLIKF